jgi:hypothetical protein
MKYVLLLVLRLGEATQAAGALPQPFMDWQACHNASQWFEHEGVHTACAPLGSEKQ